MTSDDTYALTVKLLKENNYFGMEETQIIIMKQEKVNKIIILFNSINNIFCGIYDYRLMQFSNYENM